MASQFKPNQASDQEPAISQSANIRFQLLNSAENVHENAEKHVQFRRTYSVSDYIERALSIASFEDFYLFATKLKSDCGFSMSGGVMCHKAIQEAPTAYFFCSSPTELWSRYYCEHVMANDPTVYYCHNNVLPMVWHSEKEIKTIRQLNPFMADAMLDFGINGFVTVPTHGASTSLSGFRFTITKHDVLTRSDINNQLPIMSLLCTYMHEALGRVLDLNRNSQNVNLTPREKEILRRVASGLSSWEISENLHISENTVLTHMKSVHKKFGVKTRQQAVAKALFLNLI